MRSSNDVANYTTAAIGVASSAILLVAFVLLETLRPKMVAFEPLTAGEEGRVNFIGLGMAFALVFCVLAIYRIIRFSARRQRVSPFHILAIAFGVFVPLFIFGDIALLGDIGKQYEAGLSQPEWTILYGVLAFQVLAIAGLLYAILFTLRNGEETSAVARDSVVFALAQVVGVVCGGVGLTLTALNLFYPRPLWMVQAQMIPMLVVVLAPYVLIVAIWFFVRLREGGEWYDEMQRRDVTLAASLAFVATGVGMLLLYIVGLREQHGMVSVLWFPFYAFLSLLLFSATTLLRSRESLR